MKKTYHVYRVDSNGRNRSYFMTVDAMTALDATNWAYSRKNPNPTVGYYGFHYVAEEKVS